MNVLFACVHNAGRSQMAAAWLAAMADPEKVNVLSAGTRPGTGVHPEVVEVMREVGIDLAGVTPQLLTNELAQQAQLLVTLGCGEECPFVPGLERLDWPVPDPKGQPIDEVRRIRDVLKTEVEALVAARGWSYA